MTEKIIIDGVNVVGCEYYTPTCVSTHLWGALTKSTKCEDNPNCYYKQLKRLEQENRELKAYKDVNEDFKNAWDELNKKYTEVLELSKTNADSNEYCLQELEKENKELKTCIEMIKNTEGQAHIEGVRLAKENKELKEWKERVVKLFESACRCKYLNEETDICSYTNEKCININKCVYKYQKLSGAYRSALEEIREIEELAYYSKGVPEEPLSQRDFILDAINNYEQRRIKILTKINGVLNE